MLQSKPVMKSKAAQWLTGAAGMALLCGLMPQAQAQAQTSAKSDDSPTELVVTAQKREQKLQDVPIVVTTMSAKLLQNAGVRDIKDMQILTPGLTVTSTQNETITTARIRGVGTVGDNPGIESSVGVVIDGVYRPRNGVGFGDLGEMERIEVLKGPQGTLFGKNTSAGVINIITKAPSFKYGADGELTFGNYGSKGGSFSVTGPLIEDQLAGRLYVAKRERDGFYKIKGPGPRTARDDQNQDFITVRGQLLATPSAGNTIRVIADYSRRDERCCSVVQTKIGPTAAIINALSGGNGIATLANPSGRTGYANRDTTSLVTDGGVSIEANFTIEGLGKLTSVTAVRDWKSTNGQDIDYTGADILYRKDNGDFTARFKTASQEFRLAGQTDRLNWLVGAFYANEDLDRHDSYVFGTAYETYLSLLLSSGTNPTMVSALSGLAPGSTFTAGQGARDFYKQNARSLAFFTNDSFKVTDAFEVTLGLRYTSEAKKLDALYKNTDGGAGCGASLPRYATNAGVWALLTAAQKQQAIGTLCLPWANPLFNNRHVVASKSDSQYSGTLKGAYRWSDNVMTYLSYAKGYKGGGFNLDRAQSVTLAGITPDASLYFPAETVDSYELGLKTSMFGKKLMFNAALFDQKYKDFQLNTFLGTAFVVESIPTLRSKGIDADVYWSTPIRGLSFQGGVAYSDTKYGKFTAAQLINPQHFPGLSLLPGAQMSFAPKTTASAAFTWGGPVGELRGSWNLSAKYSSAYNTGSDLIPAKTQTAYTLVNARVGIGAQNQAWTLELWGQNLTDVVYKQVVINGPLQGSGFQSTVQPNGTYYNPALDSNTYDAFMGQPRTYGVTLRVKY